MQTTTIVPTKILPPNSEKGPSFVLTQDGRSFKAWSETAGSLVLNAPHQVEYTEEDYQGKTSFTIRKIRNVESAQAQAKQPAKELSNQQVDAAVATAAKALTTNRDMLMFVEAIGKSMFEGQHPIVMNIKNMGELEEFVLGLKGVYYRNLGV